MVISFANADKSDKGDFKLMNTYVAGKFYGDITLEKLEDILTATIPKKDEKWQKPSSNRR